MKLGTHIAPRTHDHYFQCLGTSNMGGQCRFWTFDTLKAARHERKWKKEPTLKHGCVSVDLEQYQLPPEIQSLP